MTTKVFENARAPEALKPSKWIAARRVQGKVASVGIFGGADKLVDELALGMKGLKEEELELAWFKYEKDDVDRVQYQGQLRGRSKAGLGCMQGRDGVRYEGHWQNNQRAGLGVEHTSDGIYEGQFKEDMRHGLGVFNKKNGAVYTGEWERGDWHGDGLVKQNTRTGEKETFVHWSFGFAISQGLTSLPLVLTRVAQVQKEAVRVAATARGKP
ncbi:hypothetical protein T484DRAFT_3498092 [Baffinella frigidus]|nr:hypothetical protein T484DRAFT_3498092 [Cryptophyta sp. CCMP2293]